MFIVVRDSIVVSIPRCHRGDRGSIPRHGIFDMDSFCLVYARARRGCGRREPKVRVSGFLSLDGRPRRANARERSEYANDLTGDFGSSRVVFVFLCFGRDELIRALGGG